MGQNVSFLRRCQRMPIVLAARMRFPGGPFEPATITDIGEDGCRIETWAMPFRPGDVILISPHGIEPLHAEVRWVKRNKMGVRFARPLYGPVVQHLYRHHREHFRVVIERPRLRPAPRLVA